MQIEIPTDICNYTYLKENIAQESYYVKNTHL